MDEVVLDGEFFSILERIDEQIAANVAQGRCTHCGGPLHRGDYPRKPRGGLLGIGGEAFTKRFSFCCGQEGCRRRATPPSVRFLGRRVYVGAVVVLASVFALVLHAAGALRRATGIAPRTTRRWAVWWRGPFVGTRMFIALSGRVVPAVSRLELPRSLLEKFEGEFCTQLRSLLVQMGPLTTDSIADCAGLLRNIA